MNLGFIGFDATSAGRRTAVLTERLLVLLALVVLFWGGAPANALLVGALHRAPMAAVAPKADATRTIRIERKAMPRRSQRPGSIAQGKLS